MHDAPTVRPPGLSAAPARPSHPHDGTRGCSGCGASCIAYYEGAQVLAARDVGGVGPHPWEVRFFTCSKCRSTFTVVHRVRTDLDGEACGLVTDRRTPQPSDEIAALIALLQGAA